MAQYGDLTQDMLRQRTHEFLTKNRARIHAPQSEIAATIGISRTTWSAVTHGSCLIVPTHIAKLRAKELISEEMADEWIKLRLPPLDKVWLDAQDEDKRLGLLLMAFRERAGLTLAAAAKKLNIGASSLFSYEDVNPLFPPEKIKDLIEIYGITPAEQEQLLQLRLPALNEEWLAKKTAQERVPLLIDAYWQLSGLIQDDFAKKLGDYSGGAVNGWINGTPMPASVLPQLAKFAEMTPRQYQVFLYERHPELKPEWLEKRSTDKRSGLLLEAYRDMAGLSQADLSLLLEPYNPQRETISQSSISLMETAQLAINENRCNELIAILEPLSDACGKYKWFDAEYFKQQCAESEAALRHKRGFVKGDSTKLGIKRAAGHRHSVYHGLIADLGTAKGPANALG